MFYRGGVETIVSDIEPECMKPAVIKELVSTWDYDKNHFRIWGKICNEFVEVKEDHIADEISIAAVGDAEDAHIYVEHNVSDISVKVLEPKCVMLGGSSEEDDDNSCVYSSDDGGAKGVKFDDSEDERGAPINDGFQVDEVDAPENGSNRVNLGGKSVRIKKCASKSAMKKNSPKKSPMHKLKLKAHAHEDSDEDDGEEYASEELDSSDPDASDSEKGIKYEKFRKEQLSKHFQFKLGMEFKSIKEFKML
jgi:hypothetical protein